MDEPCSWPKLTDAMSHTNDGTRDVSRKQWWRRRRKWRIYELVSPKVHPAGCLSGIVNPARQVRGSSLGKPIRPQLLIQSARSMLQACARARVCVEEHIHLLLAWCHKWTISLGLLLSHSGYCSECRSEDPCGFQHRRCESHTTRKSNGDSIFHGHRRFVDILH